MRSIDLGKFFEEVSEVFVNVFLFFIYISTPFFAALLAMSVIALPFAIIFGCMDWCERAYKRRIE